MKTIARILSLRRLNRSTLARQGLLDRIHAPVPDAVRRLGGLQAQHANSPYIALWSRVADVGIADLEAALEARTVVKATCMRSTLHIVAAGDVRFLDLAAAEARIANWRPTATRAGVDVAVLHDALIAYLDEPRSVAEMEAHLDSIVPDAAFATHAPAGVRHAAFRIASASGGLVHVPPSGFWRSHAKPRYVRVERWLPGSPEPSIAEARTAAAERYLAAYGPASIADLGKWLGQPRLARMAEAVDGLGDRVERFVGADGRELVDLVGAERPPEDVPAPPRFLARWDSVLIGYEDRSRLLPPGLAPAVIRKNGDFLPTFLVDGFVAGLWSVEATDREAILNLEPLVEIARGVRPAIDDEGERLLRFIEPSASTHEVRWVDAASGVRRRPTL